MWLIYLMTAIPLIIGFILWRTNNRIVWWEWIGSTAIGFLLCLAAHALAIHCMVQDEEIRSGQITKIVYEPYWRAHWTEVETYSTTDTDGDVHWHTRVHTHDEKHDPKWTAHVSYGSKTRTYVIVESIFNHFSNVMGAAPLQVSTPPKYHLVEGDKNVYTGLNNKQVVIPAHDTFSFENKVKAAPSTFSFYPPPIKMYDYPKVQSLNISNRLLGRATKDFSISKWDDLNARIGPKKKVNLIAVGFEEGTSIKGLYQESAWFGGKKNDLVLCYGPDWAYCFGWTENSRVKREIENITLEFGPSDEILPKIEQAVIDLYQIKDWHKFDYLTVEPRTSTYFIIFGLMIVWHIIAWIFNFFNDCKKREKT